MVGANSPRLLHRDTITGMARRFQFSLKWMLVLFTCFAVGLYVFYVYPTQRAEQLVAAINIGEVQPYDVVERPQTLSFSSPQLLKITGQQSTVAQLAPRTWGDVWRARRRINVTMTWSLENPKYVRQHQAQFLSTLTGFRMYFWNDQEMEIHLPGK